MRLFFLECKKMIFHKNVYLFLASLIVINLIKIIIFLNYNPLLQDRLNDRQDETYKGYEARYQGEMTEENASDISDGYNNYLNFMYGMSDYSEESYYRYRIYDLYKYEFLYDKSIREIILEAGENAEFYQEKGNDFETEKNRLIMQIYSDRFINDYYNSEDYTYLFSYSFSTLLLLLFALYISYYFFYLEKKNETYQMLLTLGNKKRRIFRNKYLALLLGLVIAGTVLYCEDYIVYFQKLNLEGAFNPIYAITDYEYCPYGFSIMGFYLFISATRIMIIFLISLIFVLAGQLCTGRLFPVMVPAAVSAAVILTGDSFLNIGIYEKQLNVVRILDHAVPADVLWLVIYIFLLICVSLMLYGSFQINNRRCKLTCCR